jgi:acyl-CoA synthetase (AMP-forming)/AMP-acid ligase II
MIDLGEFDSLVEPLAHLARTRPDTRALVIVDDDGREEVVTTRQLYDRALGIGGALQSMGIGPGDVVILVLRHSRELMDIFWALLAIGAVPAIFPYLTEKIDPEAYRRQARLLISSAGATMVITFSQFETELRGLTADSDCRVVTVDDISGTAEAEPPSRFGHTTGNEVALLQYSSGTTGLQKGVVHTHRHMLGSVLGVQNAFGVRDDDVVVSWLPLFHDLGLIGGFFMPLLTGIPAVIMSPFYWLRNPKSLFELIHRHRGTISLMPNFALNHSVRSVRKRDTEDLDLSCWRVLLNAAEPVRLDSLRSFAERFGPSGYDPSAMMVGYGTTECTGPVTISPAGKGPEADWVDLEALQTTGYAMPSTDRAPGATPIVSCGRPLPGWEVEIVDEAGNGLDERHVGEVIVRGPLLFDEYHRSPELTARAFRNGWFRPGDLGYRSDGRLYICGRIKDVIVTGGRNIHPEDVEEIANRVDGIYPGRAVAFGVHNELTGTEGVVIVCELRHRYTGDKTIEIERELRGRLVAEMETTLVDLHLLDEKGWVIKTTNGKIARSANRAKYLKTLARGPFSEPLAVTSSGGSDCGLKIAD